MDKTLLLLQMQPSVSHTSNSILVTFTHKLLGPFKQARKPKLNETTFYVHTFHVSVSLSCTLSSLTVSLSNTFPLLTACVFPRQGCWLDDRMCYVLAVANNIVAKSYECKITTGSLHCLNQGSQLLTTAHKRQTL